ncbi:MAG TPA: prephenate dehydratase [Chitinivibrionales bacterium]|nr:prephenate dehydratase [Chitinivibrionales bacterium]
MKIAFAGERGAFAELAAAQYFGPAHSLAPVPEFEDVFVAVERGRAAQGIIPIENSLTGSIHQNYDLLLEGDLSITGEIFLRVSHYLIANHGVKPHNVMRVYSHPQGLAQCKKFLRKMPQAERVPVSNTAAAVRKIKDCRLLDAAAIASLQAAIDYDMNVLAKNIEDNKANITRFLILSKKAAPLPRRSAGLKTSVVFSLKNMPGALFKGLSVFALRDVDLLKIESRPVHGKPFEYLFYLDFAGGSGEERQANALNHLREITVFCRVLGSYERGKLVHPEYKKR